MFTLSSGFILASEEESKEATKVIVEVSGLTFVTPAVTGSVTENVTEVCTKLPDTQLFDVKVHACASQVTNCFQHDGTFISIEVLQKAEKTAFCL